MKKEIKAVIKYALQNGFVQAKSNGHIMLKLNGRHRVVAECA